MAAVLRSETTTTSTDAAMSAADRQQWWQGVQLGVSSMLTDAARPAVAHRAAS